MTSVERPITLHLGSTHMVAAVLCYNTDEPLDVVLDSARPDGARNPWRFFRALLAEGMQSRGLRMAGSGDVRLYRNGQRLFLRLSDGAGLAEVWAAAPAVGAFLAATYRLVPKGAEAVVSDAEIAELLKEGPRCPTCSRPLPLLATCRQSACLRADLDVEASFKRGEDL